MAASNLKTFLKHATMGQAVPANSCAPPPLPAGHGMPGATGIIGNGGPIGAGSPATQGGPTHANVRKSSDQRFRSFAERYVVARAHLLTPDATKLAEEQYIMVLDAKRLYAMIERAGQNIQPEDGVF